MANFVIVTDKDSDWRQYFPSDQVVTVDQLSTTELSIRKV